MFVRLIEGTSTVYKTGVQLRIGYKGWVQSQNNLGLNHIKAVEGSRETSNSNHDKGPHETNFRNTKQSLKLLLRK